MTTIADLIETIKTKYILPLKESEAKSAENVATIQLLQQQTGKLQELQSIIEKKEIELEKLRSKENSSILITSSNIETKDKEIEDLKKQLQEKKLEENQPCNQTPQQIQQNASNFDQLLKNFKDIPLDADLESKYTTPAFINFTNQLKTNMDFGPELIKNLKTAYILFNRSLNQPEIQISEKEKEEKELKVILTEQEKKGVPPIPKNINIGYDEEDDETKEEEEILDIKLSDESKGKIKNLINENKENINTFNQINDINQNIDDTKKKLENIKDKHTEIIQIIKTGVSSAIVDAKDENANKDKENAENLYKSANELFDNQSSTNDLRTALRHANKAKVAILKATRSMNEVVEIKIKEIQNSNITDKDVKIKEQEDRISEIETLNSKNKKLIENINKKIAESKVTSSGQEQSKSPSSGIAESEAPSNGISESKAPSSGIAESKAPSSGQGQSKVTSSGIAESEAPSNGISESKAPSSGISESKAPSNGIAESKAQSNGIAESKAQSNGQGQPNELARGGSNQDESLASLIDRKIVASATSEYLRQLDNTIPMTAKLDKNDIQAMMEDIDFKKLEVININSLNLKPDTDNELIKLITEYNTSISELNNKLSKYFQRGGVKLVPTGKDKLIEEQMKLLKNSHELIAKIIKQKAFLGKKTVNKKIKMLSNSITKKNK